MSLQNPRKNPHPVIYKDHFNYQINNNYKYFYPDYLYYPQFLKYWGFTDFAINEALKILSPKKKGEKEASYSEPKFLISSNIHTNDTYEISYYCANEALKLILIENRANDPYAILEYILKVYTRYLELIQLETQEQQLAYIRKWQQEYVKILGKHRIIDLLEAGFLYMLIPQFKIEQMSTEEYERWLGKNDYTVVSSRKPYYYNNPIIYCTQDCILYNHPYFKDKIKNYRIITPKESLIKLYPKTAYNWASKHYLKKLDLENPDDLDKYQSIYAEKYIKYRYCADEERGMKWGYGKNQKSVFASPNTFFGDITINYDDNNVGTIIGKIDFDYDIDK